MAKSRRVLRRKNKSRRRRGGNPPVATDAAATATPTDATADMTMLVQKLKDLINTHTKDVVQEALKQAISEVEAAPAGTAAS